MGVIRWAEQFATSSVKGVMKNHEVKQAIRDSPILHEEDVA